jgi:hypothetical protein
VRCGAARRLAAGGRCLRALTGAEQGGRLFGHLAGRDCRGLCRAGGHLPEAAPADRAAVVAVAGLWPGHRRWRAVIVKPGQGEFVSGLDVAGAEGAHDVTAPVSGCSQIRPAAGGARRQHPPDAGTASTMSTAMMMIRPMRSIACSLR